MYLSSNKLMLPQADYWTEEQVTPQQLLALFRQAYMPVESQPDDRLRVVLEGSGATTVAIIQDSQCIHFHSAYGFKEDATRIEKLELVNRMNDCVMMARFSVFKDDTLWADYMLPFNGGIAPAMIVATLRRINRIISGSITRMDSESNLVC